MNWKPMELKYATTARMRSGNQKTGIIVIMMDLGDIDRPTIGEEA